MEKRKLLSLFKIITNRTATILSKEKRFTDRKRNNVRIRKVTGKMYREKLIFQPRVIIRMTKTKFINSNYSHIIVINHEPL